MEVGDKIILLQNASDLHKGEILVVTYVRGGTFDVLSSKNESYTLEGPGNTLWKKIGLTDVKGSVLDIIKSFKE